MVFWIAMAALTAAATAALLAPLFRSRTPVGTAETEVAIYRDQLEEIAKDVERGVLPESEAKAARTEIARRLLQAGEATEPAVPEPPRRRQIIVWAAVILIPLAGLAAYLALGSPSETDYPYKARLTNPGNDDLFALLQQFLQSPTQDTAVQLEGLIDSALADTPNDTRILEAASIVYLASRRFDDAINAYDRYIAIAGQDADPGASFALTIGETIVVAEGAVTPQAETMFNRVLAVDPSNPRARLYLAMAMRARGEDDAATTALLDLLQDEPAGGADWADLARTELADLGVEAPPPPEAAASAPAASAPVASAPASAAANFTPDQLAMITQMVEGLAARLADNPDDVDGWAQLIRSYIVLGRTDDARAALATARDVFTGNDAALATIEDAAAPLEEAE
jgi:cytochrome c-type biogenesis protein CcmH